MKKKQIFKLSAVVVGLVIVLFTVLVVHIAMVTNPKGKDHYGVQLSRIDFNTPLDSAQVADISAYVKSIKGVGNTMYNYQYHNLVFSHQLAIVSGDEVYQKLLTEKHIDATRYQLSAAEIAMTAKCPVMNDKSILKSLAHKIQIYFL